MRRAEILEIWRVPDDRYALVGTVRIVGTFVALVALAPWLWIYLSPWTVALLMPLIGAATHKLVTLTHDCSHYTLFRSRRANDLVGRIASALTLTDFKTFIAVHSDHHRRQGQADEPQAVDYVGMQFRSAAFLLWHLLQPLFGGSLFKMLQFNGVSTARGGHVRRYKRSIGGLAAIAAAQVVIVALATGFGAVLWLAPMYWVAGATFGFAVSRWRSVAEHISSVGAANESMVRTHLPNVFDRLFVFELNFNYHVEHHAFPSIPSCWLPQLHAAMRHQYVDGQELSPSTLKTVATRIRQAQYGPSLAGA